MTSVDWAKHPEPWRTIGPRFAAEAAAICRGEEDPATLDPLAVTAELAALVHDCPRKYREIAAAVGCHPSVISEIARRKSATSKYVPKLREWLNSTTSVS